MLMPTYAEQGQTCYDTCNWQAKNQTNAIGAIYDNELFAADLYDCSINAMCFVLELKHDFSHNCPITVLLLWTTPPFTKDKTFKT